LSDNLYTFEKPEFEYARIAAYNLLLAQPNPYIGMKATDIVVPGKKLVFSTLQDYSSVTGVSMYDLTASGKISLGCHVNISDKTYLLLHNENILSANCENWTNLHEIGHICLGHSKNGDKEEVEAHFFAACFLMPDPVIKSLEINGVNITSYLLTEHFNVSPEAAHKKLNTISKGDFETHLDNAIEELLTYEIQYIIHETKRKKHSFINFAALNLL
jgi:Zn-dependent peptidase ImmA (M78 family)